MANGAASYAGGLGSYSTGIIELKTNDTLYIYVGSQGTDAKDASTGSAGGYNGGGKGGDESNYSSSGSNEPGPGGGGATDIRYFDNTEITEDVLVWNSSLGLNSRIMIAGGGGGGYFDTVGGIGGTLIGGIGIYSGNINAALIASQTAGGNFGIGTVGAISTGGGGGGGGGYYGGGGGGSDNSQVSGSGSGGSSFISGYAGVNAITSSTDRTHTNNTLHYSGKYFINGKMQGGVNSGNGKAKITYLGSNEPERVNTIFNGVRYIKDCINGNSVNVYNHWIELQAIQNGTNIALNKQVTGTVDYHSSFNPYSFIVDGDMTSENFSQSSVSNSLQCITVDLGQEYDLDEVAVWHYYADGRTYNDNVTYVSSDNNNWKELIKRTEAETANGKRANVWDSSTVASISPRVTIFEYGDNFQIQVETFNLNAPISSYCINQNASDTSNCTWINNTDGTFITPNSQMLDVNLYVHVRDTEGNIYHSNSLLMHDIKTYTYSEISANYSCANTKVGSNYIFTYTGNCTVVNDGSGNWKVRLLSSGTFTSKSNILIDTFLVGGGGGGASGSGWSGGGGGGGGYTKTVLNIEISKNNPYTITVGSGGSSNSNGGTTSAFNNSAKGGSAGASAGGSGGSGGGGSGHSNDYYAGGGGKYGSNGGNGYVGTKGGTGQGTTTCEFGLGTTSGCNSGITAYSGGGGGGAGLSAGDGGYGTAGSGGSGGGGSGGRNGVGGGGGTNTGGGGGGGSSKTNAGGKGGSGIVIIRNKR